MTIELNHTIVPSSNKHASAAFLAGILGLAEPRTWGPFVAVEVANGVTLDFDERAEFENHHYAFLVSEDEFDGIFDRIRSSGRPYYADPFRQQRGEINHHDGGRGVYFDDPDDHLMEVITRPHGATRG